MSESDPKHRFYVPSPLKAGTIIELDDRVNQQIRRVLRLREGDPVILFDGTGHEAVGRIISQGRKMAAVEIENEPIAGIVAGPIEIHLGIALLKADRFDLVVQKATELGVTSITPIACSRSVVTLTADRAQSRVARWQRIAIEALEQCGRSDFVDIHAPVSFLDGVAALESDLKLIAWENEQSTLLLERLDTHVTSVSILVGPEGGFTPEELELALSAGFESVSLGPTVLRSETAAIASVNLIRTLSGRW